MCESVKRLKTALLPFYHLLLTVTATMVILSICKLVFKGVFMSIHGELWERR